MVGVTDAKWGEAIKAYVVTRPGMSVSAEELVELCYNAVDDESRWTEVIYRMIYEAELAGNSTEEELQARIGRIMPHWERAFNINRQVMMNATLGVLLQGVVERLQIGVAISMLCVGFLVLERRFIAEVAAQLVTPKLRNHRPVR